MTIGRRALVLGVLLSLGGMCLGNLTIIWAGCVILFAGAYAMAFAQPGSF